LCNNQWNGKKNRNDQSLLHGKALPAAASVIMLRTLLLSSPFGANTPKKAPKRDGGHGSPCPVLANHTTLRARTRIIREMAMKKKLIPGAIVLLLASWFALDAVAAIILV